MVFSVRWLSEVWPKHKAIVAELNFGKLFVQFIYFPISIAVGGRLNGAKLGQFIEFGSL
jgi:hypothetical protein